MTVTTNTDLNSVLFEVADGPLFFQRPEASKTPHHTTGQNDLFPNDASSQFLRLPKFRAIVDVERNNVFSVVTNDYRLVTNEEAIRLGKQCFAQIFHSKIGEGLKVFNITMPKTRSFCHVDFIHESSSFEPWEKDKWSPFLRVTNSYNRMRLLRFDLGFCRWICTNGMIFGDKSITFRYSHTHSDVARTVEFKTNIGDLKRLETEFIEKLHNLKRFHVPEAAILPMTCRAFGIRATSDDLTREKRVEQLRMFKVHLDGLTRKYFDEMGPTGYAALNVITDFASRPISFISPAGVIDRLQRLSAAWTEDFIVQIKDDKFSFDTYLQEYAASAKLINSIN